MSERYYLRSRHPVRRSDSDEEGLTDEPSYPGTNSSDDFDGSPSLRLDSTLSSAVSASPSPRRSAEKPSRKESRPYAKLYPSLEDSSPSGDDRPPRVDKSRQEAGFTRPRKRIATQPVSEKDETGGRPLWLITILVLCLIAFIFYGKWSVANDSQNFSEEQPKFDVFSQKITYLSKEFPSQQSRFWRVIRSCVKHVLESQEPLYPGVLLMAADYRTISEASKISQKLAEIFDAIAQSEQALPVHDSSFNISRELAGSDAEDQKLKLDVWLHRQLGENGRTAILHHLEALVPEAALLLHGYCDGDNAPHKNAFLILVFYLEGLSDSTRNIEDTLDALWNRKLPEDKVRALLSRVANNIAVVVPESPTVHR